MSFLLDTNVISEWVRPEPAPTVLAWVTEVDEDEVFMSVASFAELQHGVELLPASHRRDNLEEWLEVDLPARFEGRVLGIDWVVAGSWGRMMARSQRMGRPLSAMDAFFAATAESQGLTLVTRNTRHFQGFGIALHNPWLAESDVGETT